MEPNVYIVRPAQGSNVFKISRPINCKTRTYTYHGFKRSKTIDLLVTDGDVQDISIRKEDVGSVSFENLFEIELDHNMFSILVLSQQPSAM